MHRDRSNDGRARRTAVARRPAGLLAGTCLSTSRLALAGLLAAGALLAALPADGASFSAGNEAQLRSAIDNARNGDTIVLTANIALTANLPVLSHSVAIDGRNFTLSGNHQFRGLFLESGSVSIDNLTIADTTAQGGHGGLGMFGGGSGGAGGAGLGGALFVGAAAHLTVGNVTLRDNQARGGNGAAKSSAHESGTSGGGGGYYPTGANGGDGGSVFSGGGGTGNGGDGSTNGKGSNGGFGGGGGGGHGGGGNGGFGGGGGGSPGGTVQGSEGFLGGAGGLFVGGGGAGLGGAIFVQQGGTITLTGELNVSGSTVQGGAGIPNGHDKPGDPGRAAGAGLFLHGNGTLTFSPGASQTQQVADAIVDATGAGGTGANAGSWSVVKTGAGTAILTGQNAYSGATVVSGGTLQGTSTSLRGNITNNASLVFDQPGTGTYSGSISGTGSLTKAGAGTLSVTGTNTHSGGTAITGGALLFGSDASLGAPGTHIDLNGGSIGPASGFQANNRPVTLTGRGGFVTDQGELSWTGVISGTGTLVKSGQHPLSLGAVNTYAGGTAVESGQLRFTTDANLGAAGTGITLSGGGQIGTLEGSPAAMAINRPITLAGGGGGILVALHPLIWSGAIGGEGQLVKTGPGVLQLTGANTYTGGTRVEFGTLQVATDDKLGAAGTRVTLVNNGGLWATESFATARPVTLSEPGGVFQLDAGRTLTLTGPIDGGILGTVGTGTLVLSGTSSYAGISNNGGTIQGNTATLRGNIAFDTNADNPNARSVIFDQASDGTFSGAITGLGSVAKIGAGTLTLAGDNSYSKGTTVSAGTLQGTTRSLQGAIASSAALIFDQDFDGAYAGGITGSGTLAKNGTGRVSLTGTSSVGGGTTINAGALAVNGHLTSNVVINRNGTLAGSGNVTGNIVVNGGTIEPGNSIGHLTIDGNFTFNAGTYGVELNARGDSDRIDVVGAGHTVTIRAGTLQVLTEPGTYVPNTTYTIVTSAGGGTVEFDTIAGGVGFLTPRVWFEHDRVQLALVLAPNAFRSAGQTPNQQAVGGALDAAASGGNVSGLVTAMANLPTAQGAPALQALGGQPWADFGTVNIRAGQLFMNAIGRQVAIDRGAGPGTARSVALAEACVAACDVDTGGAPPRLSAWLSGIGSTGSVLGDGNAGALGYTLGGAAFGIGYRPDPRFLVGIAGSWLGGQQWVNGFAGNGYTDSLSVALYGSFAPGGPRGGFYADALAGYAHASNRMQRVVSLPGLPTGIASGSTTASQFLGQVETGYRFALGTAGSPLGNTSISPFARLQIGSSTQAAFGESGSSLFNLSVAQQTTTSVRTTVGADLATRLDLGRGTPLDIGLRLGWMHELADTARPMTAAFAAAPGGQFTVLGATPQRDSALIGFSAAAALNERLSLFASYDGELGGGTDSHQLRVGFRLTW